MIRLYDSARGEIVALQPRDAGRLSMYVCGPTVYGPPHIGHGRFTLVWDVARRWYTFGGLDVTYVCNVTDIDDKIINRARDEGRTELDVAKEFEAQWFEAMDAIGVARPDESPHATHYLSEMIDLIAELLERGVAYRTSDGVYFEVARVPDYGLLAGQPLDSLRVGARVEAVEEKRSPLDFALWKNAKPGEPRWPAPFGDGRPGWHTECVVMSLQLLGDDFDLHTGGLDLMFPHHENERAQAVAWGHAFSRYWAHNGMVMVGGDKMAKSLGNFTTMSDLLADTDPRAYRLLVLRSHYRSPIEVTAATIADAERALARLDGLARRFGLAALAGTVLERATSFSWEGAAGDLYGAVALSLDDDLDTPGAMAQIFDAVTAAHAAADRGDTDTARTLAEAVNALCGALGLSLRGDADVVDDASAALVAARDEARSRKDWAEADRLRDELVSLGWTVEDAAGGTQIRR